jgi:hypothetical protein
VAKRGFKKLRRNYFRSLRENVANVLWIVGVVVIPGILAVVVPFAEHCCLSFFDIMSPNEGVIATGATLSGFGAMVLAGVCTHERWTRLVKEGAPALLPGLCSVGFSLILNLLWIAVGLLVFGLGASMVLAFEPDRRLVPLLSCFGVSWLVGLFALAVVNSWVDRKGDDKPFRGRRILSGKDQAARRARKSRWPL